MPDFGTPSAARELVSEYIYTFDADPSALEALLQDDTNALLAGTLMELQALRSALSGGSQSVDALIRELNDEGDGARATEAHFQERIKTAANAPDGAWHEWELDFTASEFDLRANGAVEIAFTRPAQLDNPGYYAQEDLPAAGIPARTSKVWVRAADTATDCYIDAWGDA